MIRPMNPPPGSTAPSHSDSPSERQRLDADLRKLDQLNESIARRDKRVVSALRRVAKRLDRVTSDRHGPA